MSLKTRSYLWNAISTEQVPDPFVNDKEGITGFDNYRTLDARTSRITFLRNNDKTIVKKEYVDYKSTTGRPADQRESYNNEVNALLLLRGHKHFPQIIYHDDETCTIYMSDCGSRITQKNISPNWKSQLLEIYNTLKGKNIYNNDVYINNFCVDNNGVISMIDFGFAKHHIDFCFYNLVKSDIKRARSMKDLDKLIKQRAGPLYDSLYNCY